MAADTQQLSSVTIRASLPEYRRLLRWARQWPQRTWAVDNANGLGRHLVQWLIVPGEGKLARERCGCVQQAGLVAGDR
ncbi:hypothetical protein ACPCVO_48465 [Streptomyces umbrinus]|uniref:hypothetical protein n=1 Tax=Streptomyces umbrinus TaxID=67370 RepID=UPI003C2D886F